MCHKANGFCHPRCLYQLGKNHMEKKEMEGRERKGNISQSEAEWLAGNSTLRPGLLASLQLIHIDFSAFPVPEGKTQQPRHLCTFPNQFSLGLTLLFGIPISHFFHPRPQVLVLVKSKLLAKDEQEQSNLKVTSLV